MDRWLKKARLAIGASAMLVLFLAASVIPGAASIGTVHASVANQVELTSGSSQDDAPSKRRHKRGKRNKRHHKGGYDNSPTVTRGSSDDSFGPSGRRWRGD